MISVVFFGSFQHYSVFVLQKLLEQQDINIVGVVTTPPKPGDHLVITKTAVQLFCENHNLPVYPLETLDKIPFTKAPDFIVVAGYGKKIPPLWLSFSRYMPVNLHPSLLPEYAGRFPAEWAILHGQKSTGVTLVKISENYNDNGDIISQVSESILPTDTKESLYQRLYNIGSELLITTLPKIISGQIIPAPQTSKGFYARQLTKEDGYIDPTTFTSPNFADELDKKLRALVPWPGVWTHVYSKSGQKVVMKIFSFTKNVDRVELEKVRLEGKKDTLWSQISSHYFLTSQKT